MDALCMCSLVVSCLDELLMFSGPVISCVNFIQQEEEEKTL